MGFEPCNGREGLVGAPPEGHEQVDKLNGKKDDRQKISFTGATSGRMHENH